MTARDVEDPTPPCWYKVAKLDEMHDGRVRTEQVCAATQTRCRSIPERHTGRSVQHRSGFMRRIGEPDPNVHRARVTRLGQWSLAVLIGASLLAGVQLLVQGEWLLGCFCVIAGVLFFHRVGWCWAHEIEIRDGELRWRAPLRHGSVPITNSTHASWAVVRPFVYAPVVVIGVENARNVPVWFDPKLPGFLAEHEVPMSRVLRTWEGPH